MLEADSLRRAMSLTVVHLSQAFLEPVEIQLALLSGVQCAP